MIEKRKGEDLSDALRGSPMYMIIGIVIIAGSLYAADSLFAVDTTDLADEDDRIFGGFMTDFFSEMKVYMQMAIYLVIIGGSVMVGITLRMDTPCRHCAARMRTAAAGTTAYVARAR